MPLLLDRHSPEYYLPLGKVERLRGDMAFADGSYAEGMQHYARSYAYFYRFSPNAIDKDNLIETVYQRLRTLKDEVLEEVIHHIYLWVKQEYYGRELEPFLESLTRLTGYSIE